MIIIRRNPKTGKGRELHVEKGLAVAELRAETVRQPMRTLRYRRGMASELLARCRYFQVERMLINTQVTQEKGKSSAVGLEVGSNSFHVLVCLDGEISLASSVFKKHNGSNINIDMKKGSCAFIPADVEVGLLGHGELLDISC